MTRPNGIATNYSYDKLSHLLSVLHQAGTSTIDGEAYTVDPAGNRTAKTDYLAGATSNYTYDKIYELTQAMQGTNTTESYSYDPVGNRLSSLGVSSYTNNTSNELTSTSTASYTYDYNGNTLTKTNSAGTTNYTWDFENRLTQVTLPGTGGTVTFKYDPFGRRIYKSSSSATTIYAYDGDNVIESTNAAGAIISKYAQGQNIDEPLAESTAGATSFYEQDGLGSVTSLSSSAGALANTYTYDSFGKLTNSSGTLTNPFQYTGRELDSETGLYYYRARYYDPSTGRFLSEDPSAFIGGVDFYRYVRNDPIGLNDPTGRIHQGNDGKLHDDSTGGLEVLCQPGRDIPNDIQMLETSIAVRSSEIAALGKDADANHIERLDNERETLARCESCENERKLREGPVDVPEWEQWFERNRGKIYFVGAVGLGIAAVALAPETGGASLGLLAVAP